METKSLTTDKTIIKKSQLPKRIDKNFTELKTIQSPPTKNVFEKSLRNDKVFLEDRLPENMIRKANINSSGLKKAVSRERVLVTKREDLEKELDEKDLKLYQLQEKQAQLELAFNELKLDKLKYEEENASLLKQTNFFKEELANNQKQIDYLSRKSEEENKIKTVIEKSIYDVDDTIWKQLNEKDIKSSKILQLFFEFKAIKENENKMLTSEKTDLEKKLADCVESISSLNNIIKQSNTNHSNETLNKMQLELELIKKEQLKDKEKIKLLEENLTQKEHELKESLEKQNEIEDTIEMLNDFKRKYSNENLLNNQELQQKIMQLEQKYLDEKEKSELLTKTLKERETELNNLTLVKLNKSNVQHSSNYFDENFNQMFQLKHENINDFIDPNELLLVENQTFSFHEDDLKKESAKKYQLAAIPTGLKPKRSFKLVFLGDSGVGKTSFIKRVCQNVFEESFNATVGLDYETRLIYVDEQLASLKFWDTAGQERYRSIVKSYYRDTDCFLCMFDVNDEKSFLNLRSWISSISDTSEENFLLVVIGNKIDLYSDDEQRAIKYRDGETLAKLYDGIYFELSAKKCINVFETIESITKSLFIKFKDERVKVNIRSKNDLVPKQKRCFFF